MAAELVGFFTNLIGSPDPSVKGYSAESLKSLINVCLPEGADICLTKEAFDSVNWNFLLSVLEAMGLPDVFFNWIKACITTPMYSVCLNGSLVGYFQGARGIRQGDPLSPYLFVIVMNVLSSLLNVAAKRGIFRFHPKCKKVSLTHICFADDLLVFFHGSLESVLGVQSTLEVFYELYLGVPLVTRKLTGKDCSALLERIKGKLAHWSSKKLSFGGRLQQLVLPKGIINDVERLCMRFFLKGCDALARDARVSWSQLHAYCLKAVSFWEVEYKAYFNWILKKLLKLHEEARNLFIPCANWNLIKGKWLWDHIRVRAEKVSWHMIIWFPSHILKFSFIAWMAILDRLPTRDRLIRFDSIWSWIMDVSCLGLGLSPVTISLLIAPLLKKLGMLCRSPVGFFLLRLNGMIAFNG
ncbi:uncharacterized protein LOC120114231 [Hibiscus syriacus]|uniref:uncharacterized protein LOC120114231 n=1 Tax=Hibiscus syriacus TaxID=106335 RepID=UPI001920F957|nr:uncharacterized protein LOC120114231 [Hibiscus syriacus]